MKIRLANSIAPEFPVRFRTRAFTLVDMMVAMGLFMLVILAVVYSHIFGLRMYGIVHAKLSAIDDARHTLSRMAEEVRTAGVVQVGNGTGESFTQIPAHALQQGNALRIYPFSGNTNNFIQYYYDPASEELRRFASGGGDEVVARSITNEVVFAAENYAGEVLTNSFNNRVISMTLQFSQAIGGSSTLADYYQLRTKVTRRALE